MKFRLYFIASFIFDDFTVQFRPIYFKSSGRTPLSIESASQKYMLLNI